MLQRHDTAFDQHPGLLNKAEGEILIALVTKQWSLQTACARLGRDNTSTDMRCLRYASWFAHCLVLSVGKRSLDSHSCAHAWSIIGSRM